MYSEIGSEFWLEKLQKTSNNILPNWLSRFGEITLTSSGRGAISLLLKQIKPSNKSVLLPAYICDSVIMPFENTGYELIYYDVDEHFAPQNIDVKEMDIGVFLHMGYYGFPTNMKLVDTIAELKSKSVIIIEDVTHTLFSNYQRRIENDFVIGSIRKWFGIPSGGFIASNKVINQELLDPPTDLIDLRITSLQQKSNYIRTMNKSLKNEYLEGFAKAEQFLDEDIGFYKIDKVSQWIIQNTDDSEIRTKRRSNYTLLLNHLRHINGIEVIFDRLNYDVTPLFFPIYVNNNRDILRSNLIQKEIFCPVHWPIPEQLENQLSNNTNQLYNSVLSIPCDQRYGNDEMYRIINAINELI